MKNLNEKEFVSPTAAAKMLHVSRDLIRDWIQKYGKPGMLRMMGTASGQQARVSFQDLLTIRDNGGVWPGITPREVDPAEGIVIGGADDDMEVRFLYLITQNKKTIETWSREPRVDELEKEFGPGRFRILKVDTYNSNVVTESKTYDVTSSGGGSLDPMTAAIAGLKQMYELQNQFGMGNSGGTGVMEMFKLQLQTLQANNQMLLQLALKNGGVSGGGGIKDMLEQIELFKKLGLFDSGDSDTLFEKIIEKSGDVLGPLANAIAIRLGQGPGEQPGTPLQLPSAGAIRRNPSFGLAVAGGAGSPAEAPPVAAPAGEATSVRISPPASPAAREVAHV